MIGRPLWRGIGQLLRSFVRYDAGEHDGFDGSDGYVEIGGAANS